MEFNLPAYKHGIMFPRLCPVTCSRFQALRTPPTLSPKPPRFPLSLTHASVSSSVRWERGEVGKRPAVTPQTGLMLCWMMVQTLDGGPLEDATDPCILLHSLPVPLPPGSDIPHYGTRDFTHHLAGGLGPGRLAEAGQPGG